MFDSLAASVEAVQRNVAAARRRAGRDDADVLLVAATKLVPIETVRAAHELGITDFGENYAAELAEKSAGLGATWHFIGILQSGTARTVAAHADVIHSAVPGRALERAARRAFDLGKTVRCLVQVDFTGTRTGVAPEAAASSIEAVANLPGVRLCGLMTLPPWSPDPEDARPYFARLRELRDGLRGDWPGVTELSMGMSLDYQVAVEEGATMLRIGTALFGARRSPEGVGRGSQGAKET